MAREIRHQWNQREYTQLSDTEITRIVRSVYKSLILYKDDRDRIPSVKELATSLGLTINAFCTVMHEFSGTSGALETDAQRDVIKVDFILLRDLGEMVLGIEGRDRGYHAVHPGPGNDSPSAMGYRRGLQVKAADRQYQAITLPDEEVVRRAGFDDVLHGDTF